MYFLIQEVGASVLKKSSGNSNNMEDKQLENHVFSFNPHDNGGEQVVLITKIFGNGDQGGIYYNQKLTMQSYCNAASFAMHGVMTPKALRRLADELEECERKALEKTMVNNDNR